jgi:hypothetical protein
VDSKAARNKDRIRTSLSFATINNNEAIARLLLETGAEIDLKGETVERRTPLSFAAQYGHEAVVRQLLKKGAKVGYRDKYGKTPLYYAAEGGREVVVRLLLEKGAEIDSTDDNVESPLLVPLNMGTRMWYSYFPKRVLESSRRIPKGNTLLSCAIQNKRKDVV